MSDPFSVAGTAVGITSLGIQTCQILIRYYSQFRGIHQDIDDVLKRVESLECILERLVAVNTKMSSYESSNLETALNSCAQASQRLKDLVDKVSTGLEGKSNQDRLRAARSRLMWPFKKETLADLKLNLNDFQDNLALALQVSGLDVALQTADQLTSTKNHIYGATNRIECELRSQSDVMTLVREGVEGFNDTQREQASIVSQELFQLQARLLAHEESIDRKFHSLISQTNIGIMNRPVPLSLLVDTAQAASDAKHHFRRGLENCDTLTSSRLDLKPQISSAHRDACTCRAKQRSTFKTYRWKILLSQNTYKHRKDCPQYSPQEFSRTIEAQITMCNRIMQFCVVVGWKQSKQAGWSSSAPVFRYRPVVRSGTGVFEAYSMAMEHYSRAIRTPVDRRFESTISVFTNHLRRCYSTGLGSPFDIDEFGRSILIQALMFIARLVCDGLQDSELMFSVLDPCLDHRILHSQDDEGCTPIMAWHQIMAILVPPSIGVVFQYLVRRVDSWTLIDEAMIFGMNNPQRVYDTLSAVLRSEEALNRFEHGDLLSRAVFRRCDVDFCRYLASYSPESVSESLSSRSCRGSLASWPAGLKIFLCSSSAISNEGYISGLWEDALLLGNLGSIETLLQNGVKSTSEDWFKFNEIIDVQKREKEFTFRINAALNVERREREDNTLRRQREDDEWRRQRKSEEGYKPLVKLMAQSLPHLRRDSNTYYLYHYPTLCVTAAEALWSAGHHNKSGGTGKHLREILWTSISTKERPWAFVWPIFCWLADHGADVTWAHPVLLTTSAHVITRIAKIKIGGHPAEFKELHHVLNLATLPCRDCCTCYCSEGGCTILACGVSRHNGFGWHTSGRIERHFRPFFFRTVDGNRNLRWMSSAILRILTFEELSLTHTCCYRILEETGWWSPPLFQDHFERPSREEAQDIYHSEREGIALLEVLIPEFEEAWDNYEGSFGRFMGAVWKPRMKKVQKELRKSMKSPDEIFRSTGVYLQKADGKYVSDSEDDTDTESGGDIWDDTDSEGLENCVKNEDEDRDTENENEDDDGYTTAAED